MGVTFQRATRRQAKLRLAILGPSGSGKTYTALKIARGLVGDGRIALIDTERGSAAKYADLTDFDTVELETFAPEQYLAGIEAAQRAGYDCLVIDSLSHAWAGKDGILEFVDNTKRKTRNDFGAWREATPKHQALIDAILGARLHVIVTMRTKTAYEIVERNGKKVPEKIGMQPIQRDGVEYEFDIVADLDLDHVLIPSKTRLSFLSGQVIKQPDERLGASLREWCEGGAPAVESPSPVVTQATRSGRTEPNPEPATGAPIPDDDAATLRAIKREVGTLTKQRFGDDTAAAKDFALDITGRAGGSRTYTLADWQAVRDALHLEVHGDGEPDTLLDDEDTDTTATLPLGEKEAAQ